MDDSETISLEPWNFLQSTAINVINTHKRGKCLMCVENKSYVESHTLSKSIIRTYLGDEVYYLNNYVSTFFKVRFHSIKYLKEKHQLLSYIEKAYLLGFKQAGTFKFICKTCENSLDKYENYIKVNIKYNFSPKDINDLLIKGLLKNIYVADTINKSSSIINAKSTLYTNNEFRIEKNRVITMKEIVNKIHNNEINGQILWDSNDYNQKINLKMGIYSIIRYYHHLREIPLLIVLIPHAKESRLLLISYDNDLTSNSLKTELKNIKLKDVVAKSIQLIVQNDFIGLFVPNNYDISPLYENVLESKLNETNSAQLTEYILNNFKYDLKHGFVY